MWVLKIRWAFVLIFTTAPHQRRRQSFSYTHETKNRKFTFSTHAKIRTMASQRVMPILVLNLGAEMIYILNQRLIAQGICEEKQNLGTSRKKKTCSAPPSPIKTHPFRIRRGQFDGT